jgi:hypothetical protein
MTVKIIKQRKPGTLCTGDTVHIESHQIGDATVNAIHIVAPNTVTLSVSSIATGRWYEVANLYFAGASLTCYPPTDARSGH